MAKSSLMSKLHKNSKIKMAETLSKSEFFTEKNITTTSVPMINVALSVIWKVVYTPDLLF